MKWKYFLSAILAVSFLLLQSVSLFGLSEEEKQDLQGLSKNELIQIILIYDQGLTDSETIIQNLERSLTKLKTRQAKDSKELTIQENLYQKSLQLQKELAKKNLEDKIIIGIGSLLSGGLVGYLGAIK